MFSLVTAVFKAAIGLLVDKGRNVAGKRLKNGDVTDHKIRALIVGEIDEMKSKLDGLARKDLLASISFFKEGIEFLYTVFDMARSRSEHRTVTLTIAAGTASAGEFSLAKGLKKLELIGLDEPAARALANAKKRFERAREKATEAFANEALELSDRALAMQYRVMATILETVDNPKDALAACRVCIEELHQVPAVKECFRVEFQKGFRARFSKDERRKIISTVCHVNRVIYDVTLMVCFVKEWPCVEIREEKVDPLRNERVAEVLKKQGMEHCFVNPPWSFGHEGEEVHKLKDPEGIATNSHGQFTIADNENKTLKVFDSDGNFHLSIDPQTDDADRELYILDVATDVENNTYVLVRLTKLGTCGCEWEMQVYTNTDLLQKFPVRRGVWGRLAVSGSKILVLSLHYEVDVYLRDGEFVCCFGLGEVKRARDITAADGRVMVMDSGDSCVHSFTVEGQQLCKFNINIKGDRYERIACHPAGEHVVVAGEHLETHRLRVTILTTSGEFVRTIQLDEEKVNSLLIIRITVTMAGRIAVVLRDAYDNRKVIVL